MTKATKQIILIGGLVLLLSVNATAGTETVSNKMIFPNDGNLRGCDPLGCGHYGAPRGSRTHGGLDLEVYPGDLLKSPIYGYISRFPFPYADDLSYKGVEIIGTGVHEGYKVKIFYMIANASINTQLMPGDTIGIAQDISTKYGSNIKPHIHLELYINNQQVDPINYF